MNRTFFLIVSCLFSFAVNANKKPTVIWKQEGNAAAFCDYKEKSICYVICENHAVDVSVVENANLGKIGVAPRSEYDFVSTYPETWVESSTGCKVEFITKASKKGEIFSISEPVYVNNGVYIQR